LRARVLPIVFGLGLVAAACDLVLGIKDYPLRDGGIADARDGGTGDAQACEDPSLGCGACVHDFCDDFDLDAQVPNTKWPGALGFASPFQRGEAGLAIGPGRSLPSALVAQATSPGSPTHAFLLRRLEGPDAGVSLRFAFDARIERFDIQAPAGPVKDAGSVSVAAVLSPVAGTPAGAAVLLSTGGLYLAVSNNVLDSPDSSVVPFYEGDLAALAGNWVRIEIFVGAASEATTLGFTTCSNKGTGVAAARLVALGLSVCTPLPAVLADLSWIRSPVILTGGFLFGKGVTDIRIDNVTADFVR
jgi:hypothetical protein